MPASSPNLRAFLDANPLDDITNTRRIAEVVLGGVAVDREALRTGWTADPH